MKQKNSISRRGFLRGAGVGALVLAGGKFLSACAASEKQAAGETPPVPVTGEQVDLSLRLRVVTDDVQILPGAKTRVWRYQGEVLSGDAQALQSLPTSYLGPVLRVKKGQRLRVELSNEVNEQTIVHWHGLHVPSEMDGHPKDAIGPRQTYTYEFPILNRAGTYWFHPHPHTLTGPQVYRGLAGLLLVTDDEEQALGLPSGDYDIPLVLQDRTFDSDNQLIYLPNGMMDRMMGFLGDQILVNGQPDFTLDVERRAYRLRILNGSNARVYKLAWEDGAPLTVIATDGGLLEQAVQRPYVMLGPAERVEVWVDFSAFEGGSERRLVSLEWAGSAAGMGGMMGGGMGGMMGNGSISNAIPDGALFSVLTVRVGQGAATPGQLPARLAALERLNERDSVNADRPRRWRLGMSRMTWTINGRTFEMEEVARDEIVKLGTQETWLFDNTGSSGGMGTMGGMMQMAHPMHVHGVQFQVLERTARGALGQSISEGFVDAGWKDTVLVLPGEQVKVALRFEDYPGLFLNHCHNLEHEDQGMMRNYRIDQ